MVISVHLQLESMWQSRPQWITECEVFFENESSVRRLFDAAKNSFLL